MSPNLSLQKEGKEDQRNVCKVCYQFTKQPIIDEDNKSEDKKMKEPDEEMTDVEALYLTVHCQSCYNTAHWNCIGTDVSIIEVKKDKKTYYFFKCDACRIKSESAKNPKKYRFSFQNQAEK